MAGRTLSYILPLIVLVIVTLSLYAYLANEYQYNREAFNRFGMFYLILFMMLPVIPTVIFAYLKCKYGVQRIGRFSAMAFIIEITAFILFALLTVEQYRLSDNVAQALGNDVLGLLGILFAIGFFANWGIGILIGKIFIHYSKGFSLAKGHQNSPNNR